ncbi:MAG: patatin-like protein [Actinomycetota bacterium]
MERPEVDSHDLEEIRFAVVMNGGVSLAVWMGGVTTEINRLTQSAPRAGGNAYEGLLDIVRATARADVISGTSAGGINGAFLALAAVYGLDLSSLRDVWAKNGSFLDLLREPLEKDPPSLLRGDDYFLPRLREAFDEVFPSDPASSYRSPEDVPVDLTITTTLFKGEPARFVDDLGTHLNEIDHRARFKFQRSEYTPVEKDPFRSPRIVRQLALAARSTASFPVAFEPSFVSVGTPGGDDDHPDMSGIATFRQSRFVMDGGVLMNQPIAPALAAIAAQPADRQVRRILAYINPDPRPSTQPDPAEEVGAMPTMAKVLLDSLVTVPAAQTVKQELQEIIDHNRRVRDRRLSRIDLVSALGPQLEPLALRLFESYRVVRRRRAISWIATQVSEVIGERAEAPSGGEAEPPPAWTREELVAAFEGASFNLVPTNPPAPGSGASILTWGLSPVERLVELAIDVFKRAIWLAPFTEVQLRAGLRARRAELHSYSRTVRAFRRADLEFWRSETSRTLPDPPSSSAGRPAVLETWANQTLARWPATKDESPEQLAELLAGLELVSDSIVKLLIGAGPKLRQVVELAETSDKAGWAEEGGRLESLLDLVLGEGSESCSSSEALRRLLLLEVCQVTLGGDQLQVEQDVSLIQFSGNTETSFTGRRLTTAEKLAGAKLAHFGAFYKEGWRINDWIWGRIDGATRLCQAVLGPERLRQFGISTEDAFGLIEAVALGDPAAADHGELAARFEPEREACLNELQFLTDRTLPVPPSLPTCAMAIARRLHLEILRVELPRLEVACRSDVDARGAAPRGREMDFLVACDAARAQSGSRAPTAAEIFQLFEGAELGRERLADEFPSDLMASTVSTTGAVAVSAVQSQRAGLGPARLLARALRGYTLVLYLLVRGALSGGFGATVTSFVLALGGAAVALTLVSDAPTFVGTFGATLLLGGLSLAALRVRLPSFGIVFAVLAAAVLGFGLWGAGGFSQLVNRSRELIVIALFVLLGLGLGAVGTKKRLKTRVRGGGQGS